jgi:hypothetical protein
MISYYLKGSSVSTNLIDTNNGAATDWRTFYIIAYHLQLFFKNWHLVFPEEGTLVPKYVGDTYVFSIYI